MKGTYIIYDYILRVVMICLCIAGIGRATTLDEKIDDYISQMSLREKVEQVSNDGYMSTYPNDRLGLPGFITNDGPHGVRAAALGWIPDATSFPLPIGMAAMWDRDLWYEIGVGMAEEFQGYNIDIALGPSMDMSHNPQNGRTGETAGEDPYLTSQFATSVVQGIQSLPVVATIKHYMGVNKQNYRHDSDIKMTEQQLMDHHGYHYRRAVQEGGALAVMTSYNLVNGVHTAENALTINEILKKRWGFPFLVMTDWWSVYNTANTINAGNDLCMGSQHYDDELEGLVNDGQVEMSTIDMAVRRVIRVKMLTGLIDQNYPEPDGSKVNTVEHQKLARRADEKGMILLKNSDSILPLSKNKKIAVIGPSSDVARTNIGGSSNLWTPYNVGPKQGIEELIGSENVIHATGCGLDGDDYGGFDAAKDAARNADYVVFFGGLNDEIEGEMGFNGDSPGDRTTGEFRLPYIQKDLINELAEINPNIVVVLQSGGVLGVDEFINNVKGVVYSFYTSLEGGNAFANVLFGEVNPAGRMPVTMAKSEDDMPEWNDDFTDDYNDGYRWFDWMNTEAQYAFGFGLSYTTFEYSNLSVLPSRPTVGERVTVTFDVTNTGDVDGEEVSQLYFSNFGSAVWHPKKELKNFKRVAVAAGATEKVTLIVDSEDLYYFDMAKKQYSIEAGEYEIKVGGASDNLPLVQKIAWSSATEKSDLRPLNLYTSPRFPNEGDEITFVATIKNYGSEKTASDKITVTWNVDGKEVAVSAPLDEPLFPGQMRMISSKTSSWNFKNSNALAIEVVVDPDEVEDEHYEKNNSRTYILEKAGKYVGQTLEFEEPAPEVEESSSSEPTSESHSESSSEDGESSSEEEVSSEIESSNAASEESSNEETADVQISAQDIEAVVGFKNQLLSVSVSRSYRASEVDVFSIHGQRVAHFSMGSNTEFTQDFSHVADGPYLVSIQTNEGSVESMVLKNTGK